MNELGIFMSRHKVSYVNNTICFYGHICSGRNAVTQLTIADNGKMMRLGGWGADSTITTNLRAVTFVQRFASKREPRREVILEKVLLKYNETKLFPVLLNLLNQIAF